MYRERENRGFLRTFLISLTTSLAVGAFLLFYSGIKNQAKPEQMLPDAANPNMPVPQQIE